MRTLTIAAIQTAPVAFDTDASWDRFCAQVHSVRDTFPHVELIVVPELMLAAEAPLLQARADWMDEVAEPIPGPSTDRICALAKETGLWLVPGSLYERGDDEKVYNTAIAVSPLGEIAATYRKVFPGSPMSRRPPAPSSLSSTSQESVGSGWRSAMTGLFPRRPANSRGSGPR